MCALKIIISFFSNNIHTFTETKWTLCLLGLGKSIDRTTPITVVGLLWQLACCIFILFLTSNKFLWVCQSDSILSEHEQNPKVLATTLIANADNTAIRNGHHSALPYCRIQWQPIEMLLDHRLSGLSLTNEIRQHVCSHCKLVFCERVLPPSSCRNQRGCTTYRAERRRFLHLFHILPTLHYIHWIVFQGI